LVLDDAAGHEQVGPLLPGSAGCLVLVTSRRRLAALEDAAVLSLDTLAPEEAAALLARLAGRPDLGPGDAGAAEITRLCGYLPLAIGMLGRQLAHHPAWTTAGLAAELAAAKQRLELMTAENLSVAAAFGLSYRDLTAAHRRLFRRLGLHPGADIDAYATAALNGTTPGQARRHLEALYDQHLITQPASGRYRFHDLIREHAQTLADAGDPAARDAAATRLLDYYLHTAWAAAQHIPSPTNPEGLPPPGRPAASAPPVSTPQQAAAWLEAERANLQAAVGYAAATARPRRGLRDQRRRHSCGRGDRGRAGARADRRRRRNQSQRSAQERLRVGDGRHRRPLRRRSDRHVALRFRRTRGRSAARGARPRLGASRSRSGGDVVSRGPQLGGQTVLVIGGSSGIGLERPGLHARRERT
jgi:hypothetical protein